jgi:hypothetical protein
MVSAIPNGQRSIKRSALLQAVSATSSGQRYFKRSALFQMVGAIPNGQSLMGIAHLV